MTLELLNLRHGGVLPQDQLILAKPMARANLPLVLRPQQRTDLTARINRIQHGTRICIPKLDGTICRAASAGQQSSVEGTPRQRLHRGLVLRQCQTRTDIRIVDICISVVTGPLRHGRIPQT